MKFHSEIRVDNTNHITKTEGISLKNISNSLQQNVPIFINGTFLSEDAYNIFKNFDKMLWIEFDEDAERVTNNLLAFTENQKVVSSLGFTEVILKDHKMSEYEMVVINHFHRRNQYMDLIFRNYDYIQTERQKCNIPSLKLVILSAPMSVVFLGKLFKNSAIYNVFFEEFGTEMVLESQIKPANYLEAVLKAISMIINGKFRPNSQNGNLKLLIYVATKSDVALVIKWIKIHLSSVYVTDAKEKLRKIGPESTFIVVTENSDLNFINSLQTVFDFVIDSGFQSACKLNLLTRTKYEVTKRVDKTQALLRASAKRSAEGRLLKLYTDDFFDRFLKSSSMEMYYIIDCDVTDFLLCQFSVAESNQGAFNTTFFYQTANLKIGMENLLRSEMIRVKPWSMTVANGGQDVCKIATILSQHEITDYGRNCLSLRMVDCRNVSMMDTAFANGVLAPLLTLVSIFPVLESLFAEIVGTAVEHKKNLTEIYDGNDDLMFLLTLYRSYVSTPKEDRHELARKLSLNKKCLPMVNFFRSELKERQRWTEKVKGGNSQGEEIIRTFVQTYPSQIARYDVTDRCYKRPGQTKGLCIDPFSFCRDDANPPEFVFYYSCYAFEGVTYLKHVAPITREIWDEFSVNKF